MTVAHSGTSRSTGRVVGRSFPENLLDHWSDTSHSFVTEVTKNQPWRSLHFCRIHYSCVLFRNNDGYSDDEEVDPFQSLGCDLFEERKTLTPWGEIGVFQPLKTRLTGASRCYTFQVGWSLEIYHNRKYSTGSDLWDSALVLAHNIEKLVQNVEDMTVLELGSGTGAVGLYCSIFGCHVLQMTLAHGKLWSALGILAPSSDVQIRRLPVVRYNLYHWRELYWISWWFCCILGSVHFCTFAVAHLAALSFSQALLVYTTMLSKHNT
jgi:hypothetical protein